MCRRNHLLGLGVLAFGLGLLIGHLLESGFLCICGGLFLPVLGFCILKQK